MRADVFEYDKMGNRMGTHDLASRGATNFTRDNNGLNQYASWTPSAINYDDDMGGEWGSPGHANGVTMQEGWITASYNALNQPMGMWCRTYGSNFLWFGYDPLGRCVKRWMGTATGYAPNSNLATYYYYDGVDMIQEGSSALSAARIYVHGAGVDQIAASQVVSTGEWRYHHYDGQGNCILLTDTSGNIREQYDYDAFGLPYVYNVGGATLAASPWGNRFLFTGREWLSDLRIYDYRARQYQPELGRFLQPDPKEFAAGDYNLYRYCHNDPVNKSDPTGLQAERIASDNMWENAHWFDSANRSQGGYYPSTEDYAAAAQAKVSAFNKSQKGWSAHHEMTYPPSGEFKGGQAATVQWEANATAIRENGIIVKTSANLNITTRWNGAATAANQRFALKEGIGEIAHVTDALKYVSQSGSYLERGNWRYEERHVPAGAVLFAGTSCQVIGTSMSAVDAESLLNQTLSEWVYGSMQTSRGIWDTSGKHTPNVFSVP